MKKLTLYLVIFLIVIPVSIHAEGKNLQDQIEEIKIMIEREQIRNIELKAELARKEQESDELKQKLRGIEDEIDALKAKYNLNWNQKFNRNFQNEQKHYYINDAAGHVFCIGLCRRIQYPGPDYWY